MSAADIVTGMNCKTPQYRRRDFLRAAGTSAIALLAAKSEAAAKPPMRPNVLWITCEDISPYLGCYGCDVAHTPNPHALILRICVNAAYGVLRRKIRRRRQFVTNGRVIGFTRLS